VSILMFVPLAMLAAIAEQTRKPARRKAYRKRTAREFRHGRQYFC
jgi:hypothetical protein